jgi:hypothetical protein
MAKFKLVNAKEEFEGRAYGLKFEGGICECDEKVAQSLVDIGKLEKVEAKSTAKK